jgi:hypothetical protein
MPSNFADVESYQLCQKRDARVQQCTESSYLLDRLVAKSSEGVAAQHRRSSEYIMIFRYLYPRKETNARVYRAKVSKPP